MVNVELWNDLSVERKNQLFRRSEESIHEVLGQVLDIVTSVKEQGDEALWPYIRKFDHADLNAETVKVTDQEFIDAEKKLDPALKESIRYAIKNTHNFHRKQMPAPLAMESVDTGILAGERFVPIDSAMLYVPSGRGSFPSMLYMLAVPAMIAGVSKIYLCSPPDRQGNIDAACLFTAKELGIQNYYKIGGAHAVAAFAYGTQSIPKADKIIGPGSKYLSAAKQVVSSVVDTGLPAGPSESMIISDGSASAYNTALDLLVEAEHGADSAAILVCTNFDFANKVLEHMKEELGVLETQRQEFVTKVFSKDGFGGIFVVENLSEACSIANEYAAEHLAIQTKHPEELLSHIVHAGEIVLGAETPFSAANYLLGPNAVLPTGGKAKTYSAVSVRDFMKSSTVIKSTQNGFQHYAEHVARLAEYEGFDAHTKAVTKRELL